MKSLRPALIVATLLLAGCASSDAQHGASHGWNPFGWSWSSLRPGNWFGSSLTVTEQGVGGITSATRLQRRAISDGLNGNYHLRQGMRSERGSRVTFWQALDDNEVKLTFSGKDTVSRIEVTDAKIVSADGTRIGDVFSKLYQKAFGHCRAQNDEAAFAVLVTHRAASISAIFIRANGRDHKGSSRRMTC